MTRGQKWFLLACLGLGLIIGPFLVIAQQQYSGGQAVSAASLPLPSGAATSAKQPALGTAGSPSTDVLTVQGAASMTALKVDGSGVTQPVSLASGLAAGTNKIGVAYPYTGCGTTQFETGTPVGVAAMPTSSTAITATTTCLVTLEISNTSAGSLTVTVTDNAGTPINFLNAVTMGPGERDEYSFPNGMKFNAGIKVQASGSGITYYALGVQ